MGIDASGAFRFRRAHPANVTLDPIRATGDPKPNSRGIETVCSAPAKAGRFRVASMFAIILFVAQ